jgi:uncharacterized protein (DUF433 family)
MTITDRIEVNPRVMLGKPVIRGTRIPVELLLRKLSEGSSEADLVEAYPGLTREDIQAASATRRTLSPTNRWFSSTKTLRVTGNSPCASWPTRAATSVWSSRSAQPATSSRCPDLNRACC